MEASIIDTEKKRGRGRPRKDTVAQHLKMPRLQSDLVDKWAASHGITRPEAIRRLIQKGLKSEGAETTGKQVASVSYSQGDGSRSVSYRQASIPDLVQLIRLLQAQAGIPGTRRAALRFVFG